MGAADQGSAAITSVSLNSNNQILAASNQRGLVNLYRTENIFYDPIDEVQSLKEYCQIGGESYSGAINQA